MIEYIIQEMCCDKWGKTVNVAPLDKKCYIANTCFKFKFWQNIFTNKSKKFYLYFEA